MPAFNPPRDPNLKKGQVTDALPVREVPERLRNAVDQINKAPVTIEERGDGTKVTTTREGLGCVRPRHAGAFRRLPD